MQNLILYGFPGSTYLRTVQMVCEHKDLDYQLKPLEFRQPSHRRLHPFLRMPVMQQGDYVLYESLAISLYLEETAPSITLLPEAPKDKARAIQWISAFIDYLAPVLIKGKPQTDTESWPDNTGEYLDILDTALGRAPFLAGGQPCLADLYLSPAIDYALGGRGFDNLLAQRPHLLAWWERASGCPIFESTQAA